MKKLLFLGIIFLNSSILLTAQKPIKLYRETQKLPDGTYQLIEKNEKGDTLIIGNLSSIKPEVRNGEFRFYDSHKILEAKGYYSNDIPSGVWNYYDSQGNTIKTLNYNKTIEFLNADTVKLKNVFLVVERMPYFKNENDDAFRNYIKENMVYPIYAAKKTFQVEYSYSLLLRKKEKFLIYLL